MPRQPITPMRLDPETLAPLDRLAQSAGSRTEAVRECVRYWSILADRASAANAAEFSRDDWHLMAHACNGIGQFPELDDPIVEWGPRIAAELHDMHEGRAVVLESHRQERDAARKLAKRVAKLDTIHAYALMDALRWFWRRDDIDAAAEWWTPAYRSAGAES